MKNADKLFTELTLPSGKTSKNRIVKAAMEENMADDNHNPGKALYNLYNAWSTGGVGMIITGNVMIDHRSLTGPSGVVLDEQSDLSRFQKWASVAKQKNTLAIMQLNHPGRQVFKSMQGRCISPSDVALNLGKHSKLFVAPTPMTEADIIEVKRRFCFATRHALEAGFDGIQVHSAHGYLLSQFLSPLTNKRSDNYGGEINNRARLLLEVIQEVQQVIDDYCERNKSLDDRPILAVKLNSADFQKGGFDIDDAKTVVSLLQEYNIDFIELSGGSYESPAMQGNNADARSLQREAYFLEFASDIAKNSTIPVMTTGGIKRAFIAEKVLSSGFELVGIASALAFDPDLANKFKAQPETIGFVPNVQWRDKTLRGLANMALVKRQLQRIGKGKKPSREHNPVISLIKDRIRLTHKTKKYRQWLASK